MDAKIETWIQQLDNSENVTITSVLEIYNIFPNIDVSTLPNDLKTQADLIVTNIKLDYSETEQKINNIIFDISFDNNVLILLNDKLRLSNIISQIILIDPETLDVNNTIMLKGDLAITGGDLSLPATLKLEENDFALDEWNLNCQFYKIDNSKTDFQNAKDLLDISNLEESLPEYFKPVDNYKISDFQMILSEDLNVINKSVFALNDNSFMLLDSIQLEVINPKIYLEIFMPYVKDEVVVYVEGQLKCAENLFPVVRISIPNLDENEISIEMIDPHYRIANIDTLQPLMDQYNVMSSLPAGLSSFNGVDLTRFYIELDTNKTKIEYLVFALSQPSEFQWDIVPGNLYLRNISLECELNPFNVTLRGIVGLNSLELPFIASLILNDSYAPTKLVFDLDIDTQSSPGISLLDLSFFGLAISDKLPGLNDLDLFISKLHFEVDLLNTIRITNVNFKIDSPQLWNILPNIQIGNFSLDFDYEKSLVEEPEYYESKISGVFNLNVEGVDPLPISLSIPSEGDWILQFSGQDENGIALPGLSAVVSIMGTGFESYIPEFLSFQNIRLIDLEFRLSTVNSLSLNTAYLSLEMPEVLNLASTLNLNNLKFNMEADYTGTETEYSGAIECTFKLGTSIEIPVLMPLPFNQSDWTLQFAAPAYAANLDSFNDILSFNPNGNMSLLPGFSGMPEVMFSRCDIKFDTDPFIVRKIAVQTEFINGVSINLPPGIEVRLDSLEFAMNDNSGSLSLETYTLTGAIIEKIGQQTTIPIELTKTPTTWELSTNFGEGESIPINIGMIESFIPGLNIPSGLEDSGLDITQIKLLLDNDFNILEFAVYTDITSMNEIIGFNVFNDKVPVKVAYTTGSGEGNYSIQILEWPFAKPDIHYLQQDGWILVDFGSFGAVKIELPTFTILNGNWQISGTIECTHDGIDEILQNGDPFAGKDLNIPVAMFFDQIGLSALNKIFPDKIPLAPSVNLRSIITDAQGDPDNLPHDFQDYLTIEVPDKVQFNLVISSSGELHVDFKIPTTELNVFEPVKAIIPAGLYLIGIKINRIGFSFIKGFPILDIDAEFDIFLLAILVLLSWFDIDSFPLLPNFKDVHLKFVMKDVWMLLSTLIPLPIFYEELSLNYLGVEGVKARSVVKFPKPALNINDFSKIGDMLVQLKRYFTERNYFLTQQDLGSADLNFTLGPTFIELPEYIGDPTIGSKSDIFTVSASKTMVAALNAIKDPTLTRLIKIIPTNIRYGTFDVSFGPIQIAMAMGITTPLEFVTDNPTGFSYSMMERFFPDVLAQTTDTIVINGDQETGMPAPKHYLQCNEGTGNFITDRVSSMQLFSENEKPLNWQKENIKGYGKKYYIQGGDFSDIASTVTGNILDETYQQYTVSFLTKISSLENGCLFSTTTDFSLWFYGSAFDICGGARTSSVTIDQNKWVRVTFVQTANTQYVYVDRNLVGQAAINIPFLSSKLRIGGLNPDQDSDFPAFENIYMGAYSDIYIFDQALSAQYVTELCDNDDKLDELPEPVLYIPCNEGTGKNVVDRMTSATLTSENGNAINWQKADIKGYKNKWYIQGIATEDQTSVIGGDIIPETYNEFSFSYLTNKNLDGRGGFFNPPGFHISGFWNGGWDICGGAHVGHEYVKTNEWVRITFVQSSLGQFVYVDRTMAGQSTVQMKIDPGYVRIGARDRVNTVGAAANNLYFGAYTDVLVFDRALNQTQINLLCDKDEGTEEEPAQDLPVTQREDSRILTLLSGSWNLSNLISSQFLCGMSLDGLTGAGLHVAFVGDIGSNLLGIDITGVAKVDLENKSKPFFTSLQGNIILLGRNILGCEVTFDSESFYFNGFVDLFDWSKFKANGNLTGSLNRTGNFLLEGNVNVVLGGVTLTNCHARITNNSININTTWLNSLSLNLSSMVSRDKFYLKGGVSVGDTINYSVPAMTFPTPWGKVKIGSFKINCGFSAGINFSMGDDGVSASVSASFTFIRSYTISFGISINDMPGSVSALKDLIRNKIIDWIINNLLKVPEALVNFLELLRLGFGKIINGINELAGFLKDAFRKSFDEIGDLLMNSFNYPDVDVAKALKSVGAAAEDVARVFKNLTNMTGDAVGSVLSGAGYVKDEIGDALGDFYDNVTDWIPGGCG